MSDPENADGTAEGTATTTEGTPPVESAEGTTTEETSSEGKEAIEYGEFTMPEDMAVDKELLDKAVPLFKEMNLSKEQAQKLVDFQAKQMVSQVEAHNARVQTWTDAVKADKELGGDNFDKTVGIARKGIEKVGSPELMKLMDEYGIGSHPEVVRAFYKIGKMTTEDNPESGSSVSNSNKSIVDRLYGKPQ
jgi:hypothetical protein